MFKPKKFRSQADKYRNLGNDSTIPAEARQFKKLEQSFTTLADNEQWLADNYEKTLQADPDQAGWGTLAEEEERVLRYLGAALIMQWNTLPTKLQRELFDNAGSMGEVMKTAELRGQIARFLHKHQGDEEQVGTT